MDMKIINEILDIRETIFEGSPEQGFECDILLPDYCPDVRRILKCHVSPKVSQCYQNGDKVNADGFILLKVYYLCDENKIHAYDSKIPFSKSIDIKEPAESISVSVGAVTNYVNCRAVNQRRLDIRGAITLKTRITGKTSQTVVSDAAGDGIQLRKKTVAGSRLCSEASAQFSVQEEESVSGSPVNAVIRCEGVASFSDVQIIPNKAIMKGELKLTTVYTDAEGITPVTVVHTLPISRIMDIERLTADCKLEIKTDVVLAEAFPKQDENGEFTKLGFDVKVNIFAKCYESKAITLATDAFSTEYNCNYTSRNIPLEKINDVIDKTFTYKVEAELSKTAVERVVDLWAFSKSPVSTLEDSKLTVQIPVDVFAFYLGEDGSADFSENTVNAIFEMPIEEECCEIKFDPEVKILSCDYSLVAPNKVELCLEINVLGTLSCNQTDRCITELNVDYSSEKKAENSPALTIYYCDCGESVWDIAKRYNTCPECIIAENSLECETVNEKRVILIPLAN